MRAADIDLLVSGAILVVGRSSDAVASARPRVTEWQVVRIDARGAYEPIGGETFRWRSRAEAFARTQYPAITRFRSLGPHTFLAVQGPDEQSAEKDAAGTDLPTRR